MKGLMVPLLMLVMTGTVVGQQTDSTSFRSTAYRQVPGSSAQGSGDFSPRTNPSDIKPFELTVTDEQIRGIRNGGGLLSKIEPRDQETGQLLSLRVINSITLVHEKNANRKLAERKMFGKNAGEGKIEIDLDDWALQDLENNKLVFDVPELDRGKFNQVAFYYKSPNLISKSVQGNGPDSTPGAESGTSNYPFGQPKIGFLPLPGPEALPGDVEFEGPVMPSPNQQVASNNRPQSWNPNANVPINPALSNQGSVNDQSSRWTIPQENPRKETLAEYQNRIAIEKLKQERNEANLRQLAGSQPVNNSLLDPVGVNGWPTTVPGTSLMNQPSLTEQQIAERLAFLKRQQEIKTQEQNLAARESELARQKKEMDYQRYVDSLKANPMGDNVPQITRQTGPVPGTNVQPSGPVLERPARYASNNIDQNYGEAFGSTAQSPLSSRLSNPNMPAPSGGVGKFVASIPGGANSQVLDANQKNSSDDALTQQTKDRRSEGVIYFMLLCSLGLNIYLGLISRGFYVRYNELADELRETFTATM